jgi:hypothetical protein
MRNVLLFGLAVLVLACTATAYGDFVAYNDLAGTSSGNCTACNRRISTHCFRKAESPRIPISIAGNRGMAMAIPGSRRE